MTKLNDMNLDQLVEKARWPAVKRKTKARLAKSPKDLAALRARALAFQSTGEPEEAEKLFRRALMYHPADARTHNDLGVLLGQDGRYAEARLAFIDAIRIDDRFADAYFNLAVALKKQEDFSAAENILRSCIKVGLASKKAKALFGEVLLRQEKVEEAQKHIAALLAENPADWQLWTNIGYACGELGDNQTAMVFLAKAFELKPDSVEVMLNYGPYLNRSGHAPYAKNVLDMAVSMSPTNAMVRWNRSFANFNLRNWDEAWRDYQAGFEAGKRTPYRRFAVPEWTGEPLGDRRLLVWAEQGLGDKLQDGFYIKRLLDQETNVIIETEERLLDLFGRSFPQATVRRAERRTGPDGLEHATDFDLHIPCTNLRMLFGGPPWKDVDSPAYLHVDPTRRAAWRKTYQTTYPDVLRVGLAWRSSRIAPFSNCTQNLRLKDWAPVLRIPRVQFFSLAYYDDAEEVAEAEAAAGVKIHRFTDVDMRNDLEEVTALSAALDLTIGTAITPTDIAHVSGCETWWVFPNTARAEHVELGRGHGHQRFFINRVDQQEPADKTLDAVAEALSERSHLLHARRAS